MKWLLNMGYMTVHLGFIKVSQEIVTFSQDWGTLCDLNQKHLLRVFSKKKKKLQSFCIQLQMQETFISAFSHLTICKWLFVFGETISHLVLRLGAVIPCVIQVAPNMGLQAWTTTQDCLVLDTVSVCVDEASLKGIICLPLPECRNHNVCYHT